LKEHFRLCGELVLQKTLYSCKHRGLQKACC